MARMANQQRQKPRDDERIRVARGEHPLCAVSDRCGGCTSVDVPYDEQLARKQAHVEELFAPLKTGIAPAPILGMAHPFHYRNKVITPYAPARKSSHAQKGNVLGHRVLTGMYVRGTHELIPTDCCLVENEEAKKATLVIRDLMEKWDIAPYDEDTGKGFLRHAVVRVGHGSDEMLVTLVTNADEFPKAKSFCRELVRRVPGITTIVQNVNRRQTNVILGEKERTLYGPGFILDDLAGVRFRISSQSFYQVNAQQTEVLYRTAMKLAHLDELDENDTIIDAYCGTGTIGLVAAKECRAHLIGVDSVASAIRDARLNAQHNGIENAEFLCADATEYMMEAAEAGRKRKDVFVLFMDPPRAGSTPEFIDAACALAPERIVYISCDPTTQVRDVERFLRSGAYRLTAIRPVDMFPHTDHIENICVLEKRNAA